MLWYFLEWSVLYSYFEKGCRKKCAHDNPERYYGWFRVHCFLTKFEGMAGEATDICLRVLKESNKSRFDSYRVTNSVLVISQITFRDCWVHIFSDILSRNSCIQGSKDPSENLTVFPRECL